MKIIKNIRSMLEERRLWKGYIATKKASEAFGRLIGARPYFMSFEEWKEKNHESGQVHEDRREGDIKWTN